MSDERLLLGGDGCDIVTQANSPFPARIGRIYMIVPREDNTIISSITEDMGSTSRVVTSRSWIGGESSDVFQTVMKDYALAPDYPVSSISVDAGRVIVYYQKKGWHKT
jgi:hypothetical protein